MTVRNGRCIKTRFDRVVLCAGTMTDLIEVLRREIRGTEPGKSIQNTEQFTPVESYAGHIEARRSTHRWNGVNVDDQSGTTFTHVVYIPYDDTVFALDMNTCFIKLTGSTRSRYFKMKGVSDYDEQEQYIEFEVSETGFSDLEAAHG